MIEKKDKIQIWRTLKSTSLSVLLMILVIFSNNITAQSSTPTVYIEDISASTAGQQVTVPLKFKNLPNVGSVSLKIIFDTNVLNFIGLSDSPGHGTLITNSSIVSSGGIHDTIAIAWFDLTPVGYTDGVFVNLNFTYKGGTGIFHFIPSPISSLTDENVSVISNLILTDGSITLQSPSVVNSVSGKVFVDANENGIIENNETGLQWVTVDLFKADGAYIGYKLTDPDGNYKFDSLSPGSYFAKFTLRDGNNIYTFSVKGAGSDRSLDSDVSIVDPSKDTIAVSDTTTLISGANSGFWDAGVHLRMPQNPAGSIGDYVWLDENGNGIQDAGELPFPNVKVFLLNASNNLKLDSTVSDNNGNYLFTNLQIGVYKIQFDLPDGHVISSKNTGGSVSWLGDSDPDSLTGITDTIQISSGFLNRYDIDAGMHVPFVTTTITDDRSIAPREYNLAQNYPNPFNPSTVIQFTIPRQGHVTLIVFNLIGQKVATLIDGDMSVGTHRVTFDAGGYPSGIYFYRLIGNSVNITKKMMLMK